MYRNEILDQYRMDEEKALQYGFIKKNGCFMYRRKFGEDGFEICYTISDRELKIEMMDDAGELYLPFDVKDPAGGFTAKIREEADQVTCEMLEACFTACDPRSRLLAYAKATFGTEPEEPWADKEGFQTLKTREKKKWYGLLMRIPCRFLGIPGEGLTDVINLKGKPDMIRDRVDGIRMFPAYHMNKKYWFTLLLDRKTDLKEAEELLKESYQIVEGKSSERKTWIVPANPDYYDVEQGFLASPVITWKQTASVRPGDLVYLYMAAPFSAIMYRCEAVETDLPCEPANGKKGRCSRRMKIRLLQKYPSDLLPLALLKKYGVGAVRGARTMPEQLVLYIEKELQD